MTTISIDDLKPELETLQALAEKSGVQPRDLLKDFLLQYEHEIESEPVPAEVLREVYRRMDAVENGSEKMTPATDAMKRLRARYK